MAQNTDRVGLPLLSAAQAQKEITHNEALALIDALVQPTVVAVAPGVVPTAPIAGQCWIVGVGATGAWLGQDGALAAWTSGGWRFLSPFDGMQVWSIADATMARRQASVWQIGAVTGKSLTLQGSQVVGPQAAAIAGPSGGSTIDAQARSTIASILAMLRGHGLIAT